MKIRYVKEIDPSDIRDNAALAEFRDTHTRGRYIIRPSPGVIKDPSPVEKPP